MKLEIILAVGILGKITTPYTAQNGEEKISYAVNVQQKDGQLIAKLKVSKEIFALLEQGKEYLLDGEYSETKYGNSIKITGINNATKGGA